MDLKDEAINCFTNIYMHADETQCFQIAKIPADLWERTWTSWHRVAVLDVLNSAGLPSTTVCPTSQVAELKFKVDLLTRIENLRGIRDVSVIHDAITQLKVMEATAIKNDRKRVDTLKR